MEEEPRVPELRHGSPQIEEDWCEWWTKMAANLNVFRKIIKKIGFYSNRIFFFAEVL